MERFDTHVSTMQAALQQRPEVLKAVGMYATIHILHSVVYDFVLELAIQTLVSAHLVSEKRGANLYVLTNNGLQSSLLPIWNYKSAHVTAALQESHDDSLVSETLSHSSDSPRMNILVHVASLAADESFVGFYFAAQLASEMFILHSQPDAVKHEPCRLLSDLHIAGDLVTTDTVLAIGDEPSCSEPLIQRDCGVLHDGSNLDGELAFQVMACALPHTARGIEFYFLGAASGAGNNAVRPAPNGQILDAIVGIREVLDGFLQALWFAHKSLTHKQIIAQKSGCVKYIITLDCYYAVPKWERP